MSEKIIAEHQSNGSSLTLCMLGKFSKRQSTKLEESEIKKTVTTENNAREPIKVESYWMSDVMWIYKGVAWVENYEDKELLAHDLTIIAFREVHTRESIPQIVSY